MSVQSQGKFIVIEGIDGSGKTTLAANLAKMLVEHSQYKKNVLVTREPTWKLRAKFPDLEKATAADFIKDRQKHVFYLGMLAHGPPTHIICDRWYYSTYAYHNGEFKNFGECLDANRQIQYMLQPDLVIWLKCHPKTAELRKVWRGNGDNIDFDLERQTVADIRYNEIYNDYHVAEKIIMIDTTDRDPSSIECEVFNTLMDSGMLTNA
jgi:dTMP kinase